MRLFQNSFHEKNISIFKCVSGNLTKCESGARLGRLYYPPFEIDIDKVRKLFKVTGIYKPNEHIYCG